MNDLVITVTRTPAGEIVVQGPQLDLDLVAGVLARAAAKLQATAEQIAAGAAAGVRVPPPGAVPSLLGRNGVHRG